MCPYTCRTAHACVCAARPVGASGRTLHTSLSIDSRSVFKSYSHAGVTPSDVTVNLRDLKAVVALCVDLGADVALRFDKPGVPMLAAPHVYALQVQCELASCAGLLSMAC